MALHRWRAVVQCLFGGIAIALLTFACFRLRLNLATTVCLYLIVIVLLSLQGSFLSSAVVSLIALGCLAYYSAPPIVSFRVSDPFEIVAIIVFLATSGVITHYVSRVRKATKEALSQIEDRKRAEESLRKSEAYLAHAQHLTKAGSWAYKHPNVCEYWSAEMFRIFGFGPSKGYPPSDQFLSLVHPEDRRRVEEAFTQHSTQGRVFDLKYRIIRPDGQLRVIHDLARLSWKNLEIRIDNVGGSEEVAPGKRWPGILIPLSLLSALTGRAGLVYPVGAVLAGSVFLYFGAQLALRKSSSTARWLLLASIFYLPLVFVLLMIGKG